MAEASSTAPTLPVKKRGFAALDPVRQREISSLGGKAAHASGNARQFSREEAIEASKRSRSRADNAVSNTAVPKPTDSATRGDRRFQTRKKQIEKILKELSQSS